jgi:thiamine-phosphate pyrophosphorylase
MPLDLHNSLIYLITSGATTAGTTPASENFSRILLLVRAAVDAQIDLVQIREKKLSGNVLYELSARAAAITKDSATKLLINDRSDIAAAAGAAGVHLTRSSLPAAVVRQTFGAEFLIGVSTHSLEEANLACRDGADFVVFGPVFDTASKRQFGDPLGPSSLAQVSSALTPFPVLALGGVTTGNAAECIRAGARGIAAIRMLELPDRLADIAAEIRHHVANIIAIPKRN